MIEIEKLRVGDYSVNCYIVHEAGRKDCVLVDPGYEPERILQHLDEENLTPVAILLTHGHFDHVGGVKTIAAETDCAVYLCEKDLSMPHMMTAGPLYYTNTYAEGDQLSLAGLEITVLHTPGHTPGSVCLVTENTMFSGDTLFCGSCGRTDLPGGNWKTIRESLGRLASIDRDLIVYPGHGESTTLAWEKQYNPYMR